MTDEQIKYMRDRFLMWIFPETIRPDGGFSFNRSTWLDDDGMRHNHPMPVGTNLLDACEAEAMVRYMVAGLRPHADWKRGLEEAAQIADEQNAPGIAQMIRQRARESALEHNDPVRILREQSADGMPGPTVKIPRPKRGSMTRERLKNVVLQAYANATDDLHFIDKLTDALMIALEGGR